MIVKYWQILVDNLSTFFGKSLDRGDIRVRRYLELSLYLMLSSLILLCYILGFLTFLTIGLVVLFVTLLWEFVEQLFKMKF